MKKAILTVMSALVLSLGAVTLHAQEMSEAEMQAAWEKAMTPGEEQAWLAQMEGEWTTSITHWMTPGADAAKSEGKSTIKMIMGGRYLRETSTSMMMGMPFEGESSVSHNNIDGVYCMSWMDNFGTGIMTGTGSRDGNTLEINATYPKMSGDGVDNFRMVTTINNKDKHTFEMFMMDEEGNEFKSMEIVYTRK